MVLFYSCGRATTAPPPHGAIRANAQRRKRHQPTVTDNRSQLAFAFACAQTQQLLRSIKQQPQRRVGIHSKPGLLSIPKKAQASPLRFVTSWAVVPKSTVRVLGQYLPPIKYHKLTKCGEAKGPPSTRALIMSNSKRKAARGN